MSNDTQNLVPDSPATSSWSIADRVDQVCDRFEARRRGGHRPQIEDELDGFKPADRPALLRELLALELDLRRHAGEHPLIDEYRDRVPAYPAIVAEVFAGEKTHPPETWLGAATSRELPPGRTRRELLLGLLASQHLIDRETLLAAFNDWHGDPARSLGEILVGRGALTPGQIAMLENLTAAVIDQCDGDVSKALASRGMLSTVRTDLERLHDPELEATLSYVPSDQTTAPIADGPIGSGSDGSGGDRTYTSGERFRWLRSHAQGGQGEVHVFLDQNLNREVALKRLRAEYAHDPGHQARLVNEAEITARLEHPGFVPVHAAGRVNRRRGYPPAGHPAGEFPIAKNLSIKPGTSGAEARG